MTFAATASALTLAVVVVTLFVLLRLVRATHATVKVMDRKVDEVDHAVNGKPPGETTMVQQVQDLTNKAFPPPEPPEDSNAVLPTLRRIEGLLKAQN